MQINSGEYMKNGAEGVRKNLFFRSLRQKDRVVVMLL